MKTYLYDLALEKVKDCSRGVGEIKANLLKPMGNLATYVDYVKQLDNSKKQRDDLLDQKKKLEEMKTVVSKYKSKEEGFQSLA